MSNMFKTINIITGSDWEDPDTPAIRLGMSIRFTDLNADDYYKHYKNYVETDYPNHPENFDIKMARFYERCMIDTLDEVYLNHPWPTALMVVPVGHDITVD